MRPGRIFWTGLILGLTAGLLLLIGTARTTAREPAVGKPRLVVLLVFDQLRGDYLTRWRDLFVEGGFRRLTDEGAWFVDCHYPYANTLTAAGHATIATGCLPSTHGIVGNEWFYRRAGKEVYCVGSARHEQVPPPLMPKKDEVKNKAKSKDVDLAKKPDGASPDRLRVLTVADALKEQLGEGARVVCLSLKDRSSVLPGGRRPDACYWADKDGRFVTSTYYRDRPHPWVTTFNRSGLVDRWHGKDWHRLRPDLDYTRYSGPDDVKGEGTGNEQGRTFPHRLDDGKKKQRRNYYAALANSPHGNELLLALAREAIEHEGLGTRETPDFLSVSFSSNDLVGHTWGPDSQEVLDTTLRTDLLIKEFLSFLDEKVGKGRYTVALTADHGVAPLPEVARSRGLPGGRIDPKPMLERAEEYLESLFPPDREEEKGKGKWILASKSYMLYLDHRRIARRGAGEELVTAALARWLPQQPGIAAAFSRADLLGNRRTDALAAQVRSSFHLENSGDVTLVVSPHHLLTSSLTGTTHGSPHSYDTHVPLLAMGPGIRPGVRRERVSPEHTAVILARALGITPPETARVRLPRGLFVP